MSIATHPAPATLGATAREAWQRWKEATDQVVGRERIFGWTVGDTIGEVFWLHGKLCAYVEYPGYRELTQTEEDRVWDALCAGQLQIHQRVYRPLVGANYGPSKILHQATCNPLPSGTN